MNVNRVNVQAPQVRKNNKNLRAAKEGALITSGVLTASTGISWITRKNDMQQVVKEYGGKGKYAAAYVLGLTLLSACGALVNTALNAVAGKVNPKKSPKAAN